jgi:diguanylate cyclase (GGDEF)-like protein
MEKEKTPADGDSPERYGALQVLIVEDDEHAGLALRKTLARLRPWWRIVWARSLKSAMAEIVGRQPGFDAAIVDLGLPDAQMYEAPLRIRAADSRLPVVVLTGECKARHAARLIRDGVQDFMAKGQATPDDVAWSVQMAVERNKRQIQLEQAALVDTVTGVLNRRGFELAFERSLRVAERSDRQLGVLLCDLDGFKKVNDELGHLKGDDVLRRFAAGASESCRPIDVVARIGGDEFAILLNGIDDVSQAENFARRLSAVVGRFCSIGTSPLGISASMGLAVFPEHGRSRDSLVARADAAMYVAKRSRRRLVVADIGAC